MDESQLRQTDADAILPVSIGTGLWLVALLGLIIAKPALEDADATWWIGVAAVGVVSGVGGIVFLRWRKRRGRARPAA